MEKALLILAVLISAGCAGDAVMDPELDPDFPAVSATFGASLHLDNPLNYADQPIPSYISEDNAANSPISDRVATLGRVLFYDVNLSVDGTVACASCHRQEFAFGDTDVQSQGVNGLTSRHAMRLVNNRFSEEARYFWDERAQSLEDLVLQPIQDHVELGFSGENGDPSLTDLINRMKGINYYSELFDYAYGSSRITENGMRDALTQFVRSIQSFDSRFDEGRSQVTNDNFTFPNFTNQENSGKRLYFNPPNLNDAGIRTGTGFGCQVCHAPPEFSIDDLSSINGVIQTAGPQAGIDNNVTKAPSLRDLVNPSGRINGGMMHTGSFSTLRKVLEHYNNIPEAGFALDRRLRNNGNPQRLNMTEQEFEDMIAFLRTLTGTNLYIDEKWSDPFGG